ncbi:hypothetical protein ABPG75_004278 [Micractinium tetrahymenae]
MRTSGEQDDSSGSEGGDVLAAAPAPAAPAAELPLSDDGACAAWGRFRRERMQLWAKWDQVSAAIFLGVVVVARGLVGEHATSREEWHSGSVLFLAIAVMLTAAELSANGFSWAASVLVLALKLAAATSPLFTQLSLSLFSEYPAANGPPHFVAALLRIFLGNHIALMLVLGGFMPRGIIVDALAQLAFFFSLSSQSSKLCVTPYIDTTMGAHPYFRALAGAGSMRGCIMAISSAQLAIGVVLPLLLSARREAAEAVHFARRHGIPPANRSLRVYSWLHRATSLTDPLSAAVAAGLAGLWAAWAAAAWTYLGRFYN